MGGEPGSAILEGQHHLLRHHPIGVFDIIVGIGGVARQNGGPVSAVDRQVSHFQRAGNFVGRVTIHDRHRPVFSRIIHRGDRIDHGNR